MKTMKKQYSSPNLMEEQFAANKYVAACDHGTQYGNYKFECNAGDPGHRYWIHQKKKDSWGDTIYESINGKHFGPRGYYFHPCNETHESPTTDDYLTGYFLDDKSTDEIESIPVIIWTAGGTNLHATENLNRDSWVVDRS